MKTSLSFPNPLLSAEPAAAALLQELVAQINLSHEKVEGACYEGVYHAFLAGNSLRFLKDYVPHGQWGAVLDELFPQISERTCQRYIEVSQILRGLPEFIVAHPGEPISKTTRASQLAVIRNCGLSSIRKVLASAKNSPKRLSTAASVDTEIEASAPAAVADEWITPPEVVQCGLRLLGAIDLDPCGVANARFHFDFATTLTEVDDGLRPDRPWHGRIFIHPPISLAGEFAQRAVREVLDGAAAEALLFLPATTDAAYMDALRTFSRGFLRQRPTFSTPGGQFVQPPTPYMLVHVTRALTRADAFADACASIADVYHSHAF